MHKKKKNVLSKSHKKSFIQMQVQFHLKPLGFMIFDPNHITYLELIICSLLLVAGQTEFHY